MPVESDLVDDLDENPHDKHAYQGDDCDGSDCHVQELLGLLVEELLVSLRVFIVAEILSRDETEVQEVSHNLVHEEDETGEQEYHV